MDKGVPIIFYTGGVYKGFHFAIYVIHTPISEFPNCMEEEEQ